MIFKPYPLSTARLTDAELAADKQRCRKIGPCGVGTKALYLNSFSSTGGTMYPLPPCSGCSSGWP